MKHSAAPGFIPIALIKHQGCPWFVVSNRGDRCNFSGTCRALIASAAQEDLLAAHGRLQQKADDSCD